jgi:predicted CopG family antitoxin
MNAGNKQRQQADGFEIDAFTKTFSIKSADGKSIMQVILELLQKKNGDIMKLKEQF